jgi:hypothetical protein
MRKTHKLKSLIVEVLHGLPVGQFVDLLRSYLPPLSHIPHRNITLTILSLCFADEYEITYDSSLQDDR